MTVPYRPPLYRLIYKWKGSLYKAVWVPFSIYISIYLAIASFVRICFIEHHQLNIARQLQQQADLAIKTVPVSFILGFFVYLIVDRWWKQYYFIPMSERFCFMLSSTIRDTGRAGTEIRQTMARWWNLFTVLAFRTFSEPVFKRFPTDTHLVQANLMTEEEKNRMDKSSNKFGNYFVPMSWMISLLRKTLSQKLVSQREYCHLMRELMTLRDNIDHLCNHDWIPVPLVYTQVCMWVTYLYFALALIAHQVIPNDNGSTDYQNYLLPVMGLLEFVFYYGLLQVASELMEPFGEDDDDFELNFLIDRNVSAARFIVGQLHTTNHPTITHVYSNPNDIILHTNASYDVYHEPFEGHINLKLTESQTKLIEVDCSGVLNCNIDTKDTLV